MYQSQNNVIEESVIVDKALNLLIIKYTELYYAYDAKPGDFTKTKRMLLDSIEVAKIVKQKIRIKKGKKYEKKV